MLHKGFLHRDIGTPTIFHLPDPIEMTPFVPGNFRQTLEQSKAGKDDQILQDQVERLRKAIADLGITGNCCGVVKPSDMTVEMKVHYTSSENAHQPVSVSISRQPDCYNNPTGLLRVHVFRTFEVHPTFGALSPFPSRRPRVLLLHHAMGRGTQR